MYLGGEAHPLVSVRCGAGAAQSASDEDKVGFFLNWICAVVRRAIGSGFFAFVP